MKKETSSKIGSWYGEPVENLSKDKLLEVIKFMSERMAELELERKTPDQLAEERLFKLKDS